VCGPLKTRGDDADLHEALAGGAAVAFPEQDAEVEDRENDVSEEIEGFRYLIRVTSRVSNSGSLNPKLNLLFCVL
jgi:hypothetical protein